MIILDTHIWIWWTHDENKLSMAQRKAIQENETGRIGVSAISCWEIAKLSELGRLTLPCDLHSWFRYALAYPGMTLIELTPEIAVESVQLPHPFHRDPADQIIVATARLHNAPLVTADAKILGYPHVPTIV